MVTVISRFRVRNGLEEEVRSAFINRPRLVEQAAGFCGLDVLTDTADSSVFLLLTQWTDEESFRAWHHSEAHRQSHHMMPQGLKLDPSFTSLTVANSVEAPAGMQKLNPAALSRWLMESNELVAFLLAPDGAIQARNRAADRIFAPGPAGNSGFSIWDYLVCSDAGRLRRRLSDPGASQEGCLLLNLTDSRHNPVTLEAGLIPCGAAVLLLGVQEHRHDSTFESETVKLANDLAVMMREVARKNRELQGANEMVERLARTDALTGLANRRTLYEDLQREIARAERLGEPLSVIMADLDHFKSINDRFGHIAGDQALAAAAAVFQGQLRPYDLAARFGGEEFVLLLPQTSAGDAAAVADRIRREVAKIELPGCPRQITISLGVARWIAGEAPEEFLARADAALYLAKNGGRNRVEVTPDPISI